MWHTSGVARRGGGCGGRGGCGFQVRSKFTLKPLACVGKAPCGDVLMLRGGEELCHDTGDSPWRLLDKVEQPVGEAFLAGRCLFLAFFRLLSPGVEAGDKAGDKLVGEFLGSFHNLPGNFLVCPERLLGKFLV